MEELQRNDINRMIMAIEHDVSERIKEIKIKSIQRYNSLKEQLIENKIKIAEDTFARKIKEAEMIKNKEASLMKKQLGIELLKAKNEKISEIRAAVEQRLAEIKISKYLIEDCLRYVDEDKEKYYAICCPKDYEIVKESTGFEIKEMPSYGLGGIILCSKDAKIFCDNSFRARFEIFEEKFMNVLQKRLFKTDI